MKIDLSDAAFSGEWNSEKEIEFEINYWFEKSSFQFYFTGKLINEYGYKDYDEIKSSGYFIPVFKTDIVALEKEYVSKFLSDEVADEIISIMEQNKDKHINCTGYNVAFLTFCDEHEHLYDDYQKYEINQLNKDAKKWCEENNIPYYSSKDSDYKLNLDDTVLYAHGYASPVDWVPHDYWFCKKDFKFLNQNEIETFYGYKTKDEIISSGLFILLPRVNFDKIRENYIEDSLGTLAEEETKKIMKNKPKYSYEKALLYLSEHDEKMIKYKWQYERTQVIKYTEQWAIKNNIPYYIPKNKPDHLGSKISAND